MRITFGFPTLHRLNSQIDLLLVLLLLPGAGCASANPPVAAAIGSPSAVSRGGVTYIADTPVHATVTPRFDEKAPPPQALTYAVRYDGGNGVQVPGMLVLPTAILHSGAKAPAVLLLHGLGGKKEDMGLLSVALANKGYVSLAIDIAGHGERQRIDGKSINEIDVAETRILVGQTVADLRRAVDFLGTRPEVDSARIGFVGISLGGIIGAVFLGDEPRIQSASLWSAGGDWGTLMTTSTHPVAAKYHRPEISATGINQSLSDVEPIQEIGRCAHPILFLYGDKDTIVPVTCIEKLYNATHDPKKKIIYPGGHVPDPFPMLAETIKWLDASLKKS